MNYLPRKPIPPSWGLSKPLIPSSRRKVALEVIEEKPGIDLSQPLASLSFNDIKMKIEKAVANNPITSKLSKDIETASEWLELLMNQSWSEIKLNGGIKISKLQIDGLELPFIKGEGFISGSWSSEEIASVIRSKEARFRWDARFEDSSVLEFLNFNSVLVYSTQKGSWPVGKFQF